MEILSLIRQTFAVIGYISDGRIFRSRRHQTVVSVIVLMILIAYELSCAVYFVQNLQVGEIENSLYAVLQASALTSSIGSFLTMIYHKESIRMLISHLQNTFDKVAEKPSTVFFLRVNEFSETFLKYALIAMIGGYVVSSMTIAAAGALLNYMRDGYVDPGNLYLPIKIR